MFIGYFQQIPDRWQPEQGLTSRRNLCRRLQTVYHIEAENNFPIRFLSFAQKKDVKRSLHPFHSLAVWGNDAESFIEGHERFDTAFNRQSPWGRMLTRKAKSLFIGVDLTTATFLHAVEEWSDVPVLSEEPVIRYIIDKSGSRKLRTVRWHTGAHSENFFRAEQMLLDFGALQKCRIGDASCMVMDCCMTLECMEPFLRRNPDFFAHG